ncbi:oligopeptide/dipeptide ABC transporter ATP-binding protein [Streptomyces sp. NPDC089424]|uniref:oligopeptide/dipeptide ABC transporter ATP-binding protein n=1 Tax=Streptomyces sp. NPDC089424 TaxID=3365917 RepID=UPI0038175E3C
MPGGAHVAAVTGAHFDVAAGECLALIGESGCGKSVLASALLGLLPANAETAGEARLGDLDLLCADERTLARRVRGRRIGLIPQSPAAHLTPVRTIRSQLEETLRELTPVRGRAALRAAAESAAGRAAFPLDHLDRHPHQLSGGLAQRAATALALVGDAPLLLADEPTTGLDRDLVDRTVDELRRHVDGRDGTGTSVTAGVPKGADAPAVSGGPRGRGTPTIAGDPESTGAAADADGPGAPGGADGARDGEGTRDANGTRRALLMITHDLAAAERIADRIAVMYAGRIVEIADATAFFGSPGPRHPYSRGLLQALPDRAFTPIPGLPPELGALPDGCAFAARCDRVSDNCGALPPLTDSVACHHPLTGHGPRTARPAVPAPEDIRA